MKVCVAGVNERTAGLQLKFVIELCLMKFL